MSYTPYQNRDNFLNLTNSILKQAQAIGCVNAEVSISKHLGYSVHTRLKELESIDHRDELILKIVVYTEKGIGSATSSTLKKNDVSTALEAAYAMAKYSPRDVHTALADKSELAFNCPELDLYHPWNIEIQDMIDYAKRCEELGFLQDKRITDSQGATVSSHTYHSIYANTNDFIGERLMTKHHMDCGFIVAVDDEMKRDSNFTTARAPKDLLAIDTVVKDAVKRTISKLKPRKIKSMVAPAIMNPRVANKFWSAFIAAINGNNLCRQNSFLLNQLGEQLFLKNINVSEDPHIKKGLGSSPFDDEGVATRMKNYVQDGVLNCYALDSYSASVLNMKTTGNAGGVYNIKISSGEFDLEQLIQQMGDGLLITDVIGNGINMLTGDFSLGAFGFVVAEGNILYPVEQMTIAGNLKDFFKDIVAVSSDFENKTNVISGSILVNKIIIGGC